MKLLLSLIAIFTAQATAAECTKEHAWKVGVEAIKLQFPEKFDASKPFSVNEFEDKWVVNPKNIEKHTRGGGRPEADISKQSCKLLRVYLAR